MSHKVFLDRIFPRHVSDLMNQMHMMVFQGTDGEEQWDTCLTLKQKEYVALGLAEYYQCDHCIGHHLGAVSKLDNMSRETLARNVRSMILFLRIDTREVSQSEKTHWQNAWKRFSYQIAQVTDDEVLPSLIGLAIGIARNDEFLIEYCGGDVCSTLENQGIAPRAAIGELESVVIFMKAASSKNRVVEKLEKLFG